MALRAERSGASLVEKILENGFAFLEFFKCLSIQYKLENWEEMRKRLCPTTQICTLQHCVVGARPFSCFAKRHTHFPFFTENLHFRSVFRKTGNLLCPNRAKIFSFFGGSKFSPGKGRYYAQTSPKGALHKNQAGKMSACLLSV